MHGVYIWERLLCSCFQLSQAYQGKPPEVLRHDLQILALSDLCLIPWASDRLPAAASPTAVATTSQSFAFASLKSAVVTAAESFYLNWLAPYREKATSTEHHSKELLQGDVEKVETQEKKKKKVWQKTNEQEASVTLQRRRFLGFEQL